MLSILVLSTKERYSSFLKSVCIFQKICFKVKVLKSVKISGDCCIKACQLGYFGGLCGGLFYFKRNHALSVGFKMKPL